ncbi:adenine-specific methyltransferase EcoRI family protein [Novosphingobium sp.]|uniref:adenine-specific methyltransferase EcoRI family protein n=1 Tax=Novosphingobium sp. TaxID=1874826 RepID=UPI00286C68A7|nr:adenine-specific methyltransferase EcoRI family protein [Novosphingobium sp.]
MSRQNATEGSGNRALSKAKSAKQDEFYTQLVDIENELKHYRAQLRGNVVLCNCDDPYESNFFRYFALNFNALGLKKLIATSYAQSTIAGGYLPLLDIKGLKPEGKEPYAIEISEVPDANGDGATDLADVEWLLRNDANTCRTLKGDAEYGPGDFRSVECVEYLEQADVVVTNPPFSLFREFVAQLIKYQKKFLIVGNQNQVATNEIANLITDVIMWQGVYCGDMAFRVPSYYEPRDTRYWIDDDGQKWRSLGTGCWYTNLDFSKRHEKLNLFRSYDSKSYPSYVNYDAIEVGRYTEIPCDYDGNMGLPITALAKISPDQFEIVGFSGNLARPMALAVPGQSGSGRFYLDMGNAQYKRMYDRVVIRHRPT